MTSSTIKFTCLGTEEKPFVLEEPKLFNFRDYFDQTGSPEGQAAVDLVNRTAKKYRQFDMLHGVLENEEDLRSIVQTRLLSKDKVNVPKNKMVTMDTLEQYVVSLFVMPRANRAKVISDCPAKVCSGEDGWFGFGKSQTVSVPLYGFFELYELTDFEMIVLGPVCNAALNSSELVYVTAVIGAALKLRDPVFTHHLNVMSGMKHFHFRIHHGTAARCFSKMDALLDVGQVHPLFANLIDRSAMIVRKMQNGSGKKTYLLRDYTPFGLFHLDAALSLVAQSTDYGVLFCFAILVCAYFYGPETKMQKDSDFANELYRFALDLYESDLSKAMQCFSIQYLIETRQRRQFPCHAGYVAVCGKQSNKIPVCSVIGIELKVKNLIDEINNCGFVKLDTSEAIE
jgi:hypothetical protein